jgi:hypothetical protein
MKRFLAVLVLIVLTVATVRAASPFAIRGLLPWHNFLSGPTAWDEEDYARYLDRMKSLGLNYITFHCYTGGAERYATYVEPLIRIEYRNVVPECGLDTSITARWGYRPLPVAEFAFDTGRLFSLPEGAKAFGAKCAVTARTNEDRYRQAQALMRRVIELAHQRGIQVGIGFEFGIHPPEFASIVPQDSWIRGALLPDPTHPASIEILRNTLDDILRSYPGVDWIWLWLHEHTMVVGSPVVVGTFREVVQRNYQYFEGAKDEMTIFTGIWSMAYIQQIHEYLARKAPKVRIAISGWGGGAQLPNTLRGLDRGLPTNIVFSCLSPSQGWAAQPEVMAEIAQHRDVWAIPWLEGDARLWHMQPRVNLLREQIQLAQKQQLNGVLAIHWRTEEMRANLDAFARFAGDPAKAPSVEEFYREDAAAQYGKNVAETVAARLVKLDREQSLEAYSPEYLPYDPSWGRLRPELRAQLTNDLAELTRAAAKVTDQRQRANLDWLLANYQFTLQLDEVSQQLEPAYRLKNRWLRGTVEPSSQAAQIAEARKALAAAPIADLFRTYARRIRSKGELGELSAMNQKLWLTYREMEQFLTNAAKE